MESERLIQAMPIQTANLISIAFHIFLFEEKKWTNFTIWSTRFPLIWGGLVLFLFFLNILSFDEWTIF